jgi:phosphate transport system ATP-binding protein
VTNLDNMLVIRDLTVGVATTGRLLLHNVSLVVPRNRITGIIGPSGAGKSTLLKCLNRLVDLIPDIRVRGTILFEGRDIRDPKWDPDQLRQRIGVVFQQPVTFPGSIRRNVSFAARRLGVITRANEMETVEQCLRAAHLWEEVKDRLHQPALTLSVGQQQRLAIARTLAGNPDVILMDEPTSALDARSTAAVEETVAELRDSKTIVLVTHQIEQARRLADWVACLCQEGTAGTLVESGTCEEVLFEPQHEETRRLVGLG